MRSDTADQTLDTRSEFFEFGYQSDIAVEAFDTLVRMSMIFRKRFDTLEVYFDIAEGLLDTVEEELGTAEQELGTAEQELGTDEQELGTAEQELDTAEQELGTAGKELGIVEKKFGTVGKVDIAAELFDIEDQDSGIDGEVQKKVGTVVPNNSVESPVRELFGNVYQEPVARKVERDYHSERPVPTLYLEKQV